MLRSYKAADTEFGAWRLDQEWLISSMDTFNIKSNRLKCPLCHPYVTSESVFHQPATQQHTDYKQKCQYDNTVGFLKYQLLPEDCLIKTETCYSYQCIFYQVVMCNGVTLWSCRFQCPSCVNAKIYCLSLAGIAGSNSAGGMDTFLLWVLSGRGLCDGPIPRPEECKRLWCVIVCDLDTSSLRRPWPALGCWAMINIIEF
jgi:hypothetical protein